MLDRLERDVQDRVVQDDDYQADHEYAEDPPPARVDRLSIHRSFPHRISLRLRIASDGTPFRYATEAYLYP